MFAIFLKMQRKGANRRFRCCTVLHLDRRYFQPLVVHLQEQCNIVQHLRGNSTKPQGGVMLRKFSGLGFDGRPSRIGGKTGRWKRMKSALVVVRKRICRVSYSNLRPGGVGSWPSLASMHIIHGFAGSSESKL